MFFGGCFSMWVSEAGKRELLPRFSAATGSVRLVFPLRAATETVHRGQRSPWPRFPRAPQGLARVGLVPSEGPVGPPGYGRRPYRPARPGGVAPPASY